MKWQVTLKVLCPKTRLLFVYEGRISLWSFTHLILFGVLLIALAFIHYKTTELAFADKRVFAKFGFISCQTVELYIQKEESIQVHQGILGRIFNYGSFVISGAGNPQAPIPGISDPVNHSTQTPDGAMGRSL